MAFNPNEDDVPRTGFRIPRIVRFDSFSDEEVERRKSGNRRRGGGGAGGGDHEPRAGRRRVAFEDPPLDPHYKRVPSPPTPRSRDQGRPTMSGRQVPSPPSSRPRGADEEGLLDPSEFVRVSSRARVSEKRVPSPPSSPAHRRRVSFNGHPSSGASTPPREEGPRGGGFLSPPSEAHSYGTSRDRSPRVRYRNVDTPPSPSLVPATPYRVVEGSPGAPESRRRAMSRDRFRTTAAAAAAAATVAPSDSNSARPSQASSSSSSSSGTLGDKVYRYEPLGRREFRLVKVWPFRMATVKCSIVRESLDKPPRYIAISYAWGDAGDTRQIHVDGVSVPVAASLCGALEAVRQRGEAVLVWIDALCIDQSNRRERTEQVQLMASIYAKAESVAVWLGSEADDSSLAVDLLREITDLAGSHEKVKQLLSSLVGKRDLGAVVALFERDYWRRLWVVQEVFNARVIAVYCGSRKLPWAVFELASRVFRRHRADLDRYFPGSFNRERREIASPTQFTLSQALVHQGPASLPDLSSIADLGDESLLEVLRVCRRKLAADPRDKVYGILGVLPAEVRKDFTPDYGLSVKDVYSMVVDVIMTTTERVDVLCEAIHFPLHVGSANLPTFVPDWSHIPQTASLASSFDFRAAGSTKAQFKFLDDRRNKLQLSAIYLDTVKSHGVSVGTLCTLADYLMAFLHWRALLLGSHDAQDDGYSLRAQEDFCRTLCLGQVPGPWKNRPRDWMEACYLVFASLLHERLPSLPLDKDLDRYVDAKVNAIKPEDRRRFLQENFGARMMGRCFCLTVDGRMGMGTGFMSSGDVVVIPLGCDTPILVRPEGGKGEYRFVGDVYVNGYMQGKAVDQWRNREREVRKYILH